MTIDRRFLVLGAPFILGACTTRREELVLETPRIDPYYAAMYAEVQGEPYPIPAIDLTKVDERWLRREVAYRGREYPGTIVVDPSARYAYLVMENGRAMRYGVGVGKEEGFNLTGIASIGRKATWPRWTPTQDMIRREPDRYGPFAGGLPPARRTRSARGRSISTAVTATRSIACTAPPSPGRSARRSPPAASAS